MVSFATRSVLAAVLSLATALGVAAQDRYETTEIADGVYQFRWIGHNAMFVTTGAGVVAFDPIGVDAARQFAAEIQRTAPGSPLAAIVYRWDRPAFPISDAPIDHATGAGALMEAMGHRPAFIPIIAHRARGRAHRGAPARERGRFGRPLRPPSRRFGTVPWEGRCLCDGRSSDDEVLGTCLLGRVGCHQRSRSHRPTLPPCR